MFSKIFCVSLVIVVMCAAPAFAEQDLARQSQNPIGNMISLPMQNNTYFGVGPSEDWANSFQFQPVYPVSFGKINLINRAIIPVNYLPAQEIDLPERVQVPSAPGHAPVSEMIRFRWL